MKIETDKNNAIQTARSQDMASPAGPAAPDAIVQKIPNQKQSWGEAHKHGTFNFIRNVLVNYIINFTLAATITYAVDSSRPGAWFRGVISENFKNPFAQFAIKFGTRTQLLLCGGHVLQPFLKWMKDNQQRQEFWMGHKLDQMQEFFGRGNTASKRSLKEYERVSELVAVGDHKSKKDSSVTQLSDEDKVLLAKNNIDSKLHFKEHRQRWWPVIKARLTGVLFTTLTSVGLTLWSEAKFLPEHARFDYQETKWGKKLGDNVVAKIPGVSWAFKNPRPIPESPDITGHQLIGKYFIDDMIYTLMSKLGFDLMERHNDKKVLIEEAHFAKQEAQIAEAAAANAERAALRAESALKKETALEARQKIIAAGPKDARAHADSMPAPSMAMS